MMFRDMRRSKQALSEEECREILATEKRGVLSMTGEDGYPYAIPMNFLYENGKLYFHSAREGFKVDCLRNNPKVCFVTYDRGYAEEGEWALRVRGVVVFGTIRFIEDMDILRKLGYKYYPTREEADAVAERSGGKARLLEMTIEHMTGKRVTES